MGIKNPFPMTKNTSKGISFLEVLNSVTVHSQTEKCVEMFPHLVIGRRNMPEFSK